MADGYPENAIALVGKITERLLKQLWIHHGAPGTPDGKALADLISGCRPYIRSHRVIGALHEILGMASSAVSNSYNPSPLMLGSAAYLILFIPVVVAARWIETKYAWKR